MTTGRVIINFIDNILIGNIMTTAATITTCTNTDHDTLLSDLRAAMLAHDWNYQMSDDYVVGVWCSNKTGTYK
ncbi:MAG: hypothetical protein ACMV1B_11580 [Prevotella sp.]